MISSFQCKNFKCFKDTGKIRIAPITVVVGPNNSGKSSLISAFNILSLTALSEDRSIYLKLLSKEYDYGTFKDISFEHDGDNVIEFRLSLPRPKGRPFEFLTSDELSLVMRFGFLKQRLEIYLENFSLLCGHDTILELTEHKYRKTIKARFDRFSEELNRKLSSYCNKNGIIYDWRPNLALYGKLEDDAAAGRAFTVSRLLNYFANNLKRYYHLGPLRMPPSRSYLFSGEISARIGGTGERALLNYATLAKRRSSEAEAQIDKVNQALYRMGFLEDFQPQSIGERYYEFWGKHPQSNLSANLADSGFGASQVLPILFLLYTARENSILSIEQPELHLHPAAQAELGSVFADACSSRKIKTIVETHSETFILRLLTEVASGRLQSDDIVVYYINPAVGGHEVIEIPVSPNGEFLKEWPKGFFEEGYQESVRLSKARGGLSQ